MTKFRIICPECGAVIVTQFPEAAIWELCPGCKHHVWDIYDAMLADVYTSEPPNVSVSNMHPNN